MITSLSSINSALQRVMRQQIETAFKESDSDGDGMLNQAEFDTFINSTGTLRGVVIDTKKDLSELFAEADTDDDELLSLKEAKSTISQKEKAPTGLSAMDNSISLASVLMGGGGSSTGSIFSFLDTDGDGAVSVEEILAVYSKNAAAMYSKIQQSGLLSGNDLDISA